MFPFLSEIQASTREPAFHDAVAAEDPFNMLYFLVDWCGR